MHPTGTTTTTPTLTFGDVTVTRAVESVGSIGMTPDQFFPGTDPAAWEGQEGWLRPHFLESDGGSVMASTARTAFQTWIIRSGGRTILIDTAIGDGKDRADVPAWHHLSTGFLDRLAEAGVAPAEVDVVVNTHLHADHVGWNTRSVDGRWVPTFPNARYLIDQAELQFWDPAAANPSKGPDAKQVWADSVQPLLDAGVVTAWTGAYRIDDAVTVEAAPGHTPGASVVRVRSGDAEALFVGDTLHSPAQVADARTSSCFDEDTDVAGRTRLRIFAEAAERGIPLFPAHFGGHAGFTVRADGRGFTIADWQPLDAI
ncbi:MBL fold metallo-hydrolase [uncultured Amnibacterium sp.]|uniref:MBL fold metallo-hydrolase n=1 Tax=uncultured Amnibacterium sp. TaxID=1631851 RepID=UPI0035CAFEC0